ncbi:hypothetical protein bpr_II155 (plasmid) [Butyrivibrio proteoclasticus B316]|uniref:Uncharacterized protein n=1 Tax=Butyrivibrio proteoclasticus (strain ATCC 51982 / DSM 14932 / B316) TaxID=515622 RepID=E0S3W1_BUTPB|nr:hypothetical protein [Butyrivibrio proteoclasticus]ADL36093.1 hypothetical protein bpr_II155 [Butyrivibrio proteoclasticus B316]
MRAYFRFKTNIPDTIKEKTTVQVDSITLKSESGKLIEVRLCGESEYGVENGRYDARWKGLEFGIGDNDPVSDDEISEDTYEKLVQELKGSKLYSIEYYWEDDRYWNIPKEDFHPSCQDIELEIRNGDDVAGTWKKDRLFDEETLSELNSALDRIKNYPKGFEFTIKYSEISSKAKLNALELVLNKARELKYIKSIAIGHSMADLTGESGRFCSEETFKRL